MQSIVNLFSNTNGSPATTYKDIFMDILVKRENVPFTISELVKIYSFNSKKKIEDIMAQIDDMRSSINQLITDPHILCYYYCKSDKIYYILEYSHKPIHRKIKCDHACTNNRIIFNSDIDDNFTRIIDYEIICDAIINISKYINYDIKCITIDGSHILKYLVVHNEWVMLECMIEKYGIVLTDDVVLNGITYDELLHDSIEKGYAQVTNVLNHAYYTSLLVHNKNTLPDKCLPGIYNNIKIVTFAIVVSIIMNVVTTLYALNL